MKSDAIKSLDAAIPGVRQERSVPPDWPGQFEIVPETGEVADEIEDELFNEGDAAAEAFPVAPHLPDIETEIEAADIPGPDVGSLPVFADELGSIFGTDFPGAPTSGGVGRGTGRRPPTDLLAFYLPWHEFHVDVWGIYLIVQGIEALGRDIYFLSRPWLTRGEANRVAQTFLFHHEAYHNVAETFAARLEVSHRWPCYLAGFRQIWRNGFASNLHEEGLADAYAHEKVRTETFSDTLPPLRSLKRGVAAAALHRILRSSPPPYDSARQILSGAIRWDDAEYEFQESNHSACGFGLPRSAAEIWRASGHAMHPSLGRNRRFSYLIDRNHHSVRQALNVPHFSRREFVRRVAVAVGGHEGPGGKHAKWITSSGKSVPLPRHKDLERPTCRKILRQLGLRVSLSQFMAAMDDELKGLGHV